MCRTQTSGESREEYNDDLRTAFVLKQTECLFLWELQGNAKVSKDFYTCSTHIKYFSEIVDLSVKNSTYPFCSCRLKCQGTDWWKGRSTQPPGVDYNFESSKNMVNKWELYSPGSTTGSKITRDRNCKPSGCSIDCKNSPFGREMWKVHPYRQYTKNIVKYSFVGINQYSQGTVPKECSKSLIVETKVLVTARCQEFCQKWINVLHVNSNIFRFSYSLII